MTVTQEKPLAGIDPTRPWTFEDLLVLPDAEGWRFELFEGTLLVSPIPPIPHGSVVVRLRDILLKQLPESLKAGENFGVLKQDHRSYFVPDLTIFDAEMLGSTLPALPPSTVSLAIEVVSPGNPANDHVIKRNGYAITGVKEFWIVDPRTQTVTVLTGPTPNGYTLEKVYGSGDLVRAQEPLTVEVPVASLFG